MSTNSTAGPWARTGQNFVFSETTGDILAMVCSDLENLSEEEADAQAIMNGFIFAAAQDMLVALKAVIAVADRKTAEFDLARAAVEKAEGRGP